VRKPLVRQTGFDAEAFYDALACVVKARKVPWRQVAKETGITASTLSRMAQGRRPDAASLAVLSAWAGINPADFVKGRTKSQNRDSLLAIATLLRADPDLPQDEAKALEQIIRLAYSRFRRRSP
jgi:transcriptional regulator with XRE-family HTH domain